MNRPASRRFTLIDAMILIAAVALGLAGIRAERSRHLHPATLYLEVHDAAGYGGEYISMQTIGGLTIITGAGVATSGSGFLSAPPAPPRWLSMLREWAGPARLAAPGLVALGVAMLLIRLRRPRPPWPRLIRQAGLVASLGATLALAVQFASALGKLLFQLTDQATMSPPSAGPGPGPSRLGGIVCQATQPHFIGLVVVVCWMALAFGGRRSREHGWINRGGIVVGLGWVGMLLVELFQNEPA